jgi:hypothetical protein
MNHQGTDVILSVTVLYKPTILSPVYRGNISGNKAEGVKNTQGSIFTSPTFINAEGA